MIFTEEWLRQYVNPALGTDELADALTMALNSLPDLAVIPSI